MAQQEFKREEKLKRQKIIGRLFKDGQSMGMYPLRLIWAPVSEKQGEAPVQIAVSIPKKKFPRAVDRNRLRRQIREAYRLNKGWLYRRQSASNQQFALMVLYVAKEPAPYAVLEAALQRALRRWSKEVAPPSNNDKV